MTKRTFIAALVGGLLLTPLPASGQIGVAARAGTLGIGGEAALNISDRLVVRGGIGLVPLTVSTTFDGIDVELELPDSWYNLGLDLYLNSAFRIGAGFLFRPDDPTLTGDLQGPVDVGGLTLTPEQIGTLTYLLVGFGKHTSSGFGLSLDVGAAFTGDPQVTLDASGGTFSDQPELDARLQQEAQDFEDDMKGYLKVWPILSLGVRLGIG